jgi:hypothetical protein
MARLETVQTFGAVPEWAHSMRAAGDTGAGVRSVPRMHPPPAGDCPRLAADPEFCWEEVGPRRTFSPPLTAGAQRSFEALRTWKLAAGVPRGKHLPGSNAPSRLIDHCTNMFSAVCRGSCWRSLQWKSARVGAGAAWRDPDDFTTPAGLGVETCTCTQTQPPRAARDSRLGIRPRGTCMTCSLHVLPAHRSVDTKSRSICHPASHSHRRSDQIIWWKGRRAGRPRHRRVAGARPSSGNATPRRGCDEYFTVFATKPLTHGIDARGTRALQTPSGPSLP